MHLLNLLTTASLLRSIIICAALFVSIYICDANAKSAAGNGRLSSIRELQNNKNIQNHPIKITSKHIYISQSKSEILFQDEVSATQRDIKMLANKMVVHYDNVSGKNNAGNSDTKGGIKDDAAGGTKGDAKGDTKPGAQRAIHEVSKINAYGNVRFFTKNIKASGDSGYYNVKNGYVLISGNVKASEKGSTLRGNRFTYYVNSAKMQISNEGIRNAGKKTSNTKSGVDGNHGTEGAKNSDSKSKNVKQSNADKGDKSSGNKEEDNRVIIILEDLIDDKSQSDDGNKNNNENRGVNDNGQ